MVTCDSEDWRNGFRREEVRLRQKTHEQWYEAVEELVLNQDAPASEIHRTERHFEHKNYIIANLTFPYWKFLFFFDTSFNYLYSRNNAVNFVQHLRQSIV